jgi:hypothetical protein
MTTIYDLIDKHGTPEAVLAWAETTGTDLLSTFDLTDEEFDLLRYPPDGEYEDGRDRRRCPLCPFVAYGGITSTSWEMHDHNEASHPAGRPS